MAAPKVVAMAGAHMGVGDHMVVGDHTGVAADPMGRAHTAVPLAVEVRGSRGEEGCCLWKELT